MYGIVHQTAPGMRSCFPFILPAGTLVETPPPNMAEKSTPVQGVDSFEEIGP
jgi:hypothetical protein